MNRFSISQTDIPDLKIIERQHHRDDRGWFSRLFCAEELRAAGWNDNVVQANCTYTARRGTVRGLHFQHPPHAEMKLVTCLHGAIWDVAVDLRSESSSFLNWVGVELSEKNRRALLLPKFFAHGFQTLTDDVELLYFHSAAFHPAAEDGLNATDPELSISWPLTISDMSDRDEAFAHLRDRVRSLQ